jgi:hypothetical protein
MGDSQAVGNWRSHLYFQTSLRRRAGDIRLLTIQPRKHAAPVGAPPIQCFLKLASLEHDLDFVAISHDYHDNCSDDGNDSRGSRVSVNGALVPVSNGVLSMFEHLQHESDPVTAWLDIFCVNQEDVEERSLQTSQISGIFSKASSTFIWLGPAADGSDEAMAGLGRLADEELTPVAQKLLMKVLSKTPLAPQQAKATPLTGQDITPEKQPSLDEQLDTLRSSFQALLHRKYWSRLWAVQELAFTASGFVVCGRQRLDLDLFNVSAGALDGILNMATYSRWLSSTKSASPRASLDDATPANFRQSPAIRLLGEREFFRGGRSWWSATEHALLSVFSRYLVSGLVSQLELTAEDPRDIVYSMVGLSTDAKELGITIDYSKSYDKVCMETTAALLSKTPKLLQLCRGHHSTNSELPSWVVDWNSIRLPSSYDAGCAFNACGTADARFYRLNTEVPGQISLRGALVDRVESMFTSKPASSIETLLEESLKKPKSPYDSAEKTEMPTSMVTENSFITHSGYVGFGTGIDCGDSIAIPYGSEVPLALRTCGETYRIVGEVYVHGIMGGQFMKLHRKELAIRIS